MDNVEGKAPPQKARPKRKTRAKQTEAVNMLSSDEAPTPKPTPKRMPKPKTAVNVPDGKAPQDEPKKRVVKSRAKPKTAVNVPEGEFIEKAKLKQLKDAERIYSKAIKSLTK